MPRRASLATIRKQIAALEAKAKKLKAMQKPGVAQVAALVKKHKLTAADLQDVLRSGRPSVKADGRRISKLRGRKAAVKYRDKAGNQWSGRGLKPKWLNEAEKAGHKREEFLVKG